MMFEDNMILGELKQEIENEEKESVAD